MMDGKLMTSSDPREDFLRKGTAAFEESINALEMTKAFSDEQFMSNRKNIEQFMAKMIETNIAQFNLINKLVNKLVNKT